MSGSHVSDESAQAPRETVPVATTRIERIHDLLASILLDEYDPAVDRLPVEHDDRFAALEETINLFARQLDLIVRERRESIRQLEQSRRDLEEKLATIEEQRAAIRTMSTPVVELWDDILALPIVGAIDARRADEMIADLLQRVTHRRARCVIIDLTGVDLVDTATAGHFMRLVSTMRLVGAFAVISGINPQIAAAMTELGIELAGTPTLATLKDGLKACFTHLGRNRAARHQ